MVVVVAVGLLVMVYARAHRTIGANETNATSSQQRAGVNDNRIPPSVTLPVILDTPPIHGLPVRLIIPAINVNASIDQVGLTAEGAMDVPQAPSRVAWLNTGPRPGEIGSAVIDGHFGWFKNIPAVFHQLHLLRPGDLIIVEEVDGRTTFIVRALEVFDLQQDATAVFVSNDGRAHLNLITCEGTWDPALQQYSDRLVVFADRQ